jgi:hypothetical protein
VAISISLSDVGILYIIRSDVLNVNIASSITAGENGARVLGCMGEKGARAQGSEGAWEQGSMGEEVRDWRLKS